MLKPIKKVRQAFRQYTGSPVWPVTLCSCTTVCIYIRITMVRVHEYEGNHTSVFMVHSTRQESSIRCSAGRGRTMGNNTSALAPQTNNKQSFSFNSQSTDFCINFRQFFLLFSIMLISKCIYVFPYTIAYLYSSYSAAF